MKKMKLRKYVLPTIYVLIILVTFLSVSLINNHLLKNVTNYNYSKSIMKDVTENVLSEILPDKFERPYLSENVKLLSGFYSKDYDDESQKNSLIVYQNTYMPSSGTFYASQDEFDVVSVYDGKVKSIKKDEMLGDTVEVQHSLFFLTLSKEISFIILIILIPSSSKTIDNILISFIDILF